MNKKILLAIETSSELCGVIAYCDENEFVEINLRKRKSHSAQLQNVVDRAVSLLGRTPSDIEKVFVSAGPGSFTGLRIGLSFGKGIAEGLGIPLLLVNTLEAMAFQVAQLIKEGSEMVITIKSGTDDYFVATYKLPFIPTGDNSAIKLVSGTELINQITSEQFLIASTNWIGHKKFINLSFPNPFSVLKTGLQAPLNSESDDVALLEPNYLKEFIVRRKIS